MNIEELQENLKNVEEEMNKRANVVISNDPTIRELIGMKKGLEMSLNGSVENEEPSGEVNAS